MEFCDYREYIGGIVFYHDGEDMNKTTRFGFVNNGELLMPSPSGRGSG